MLKSQMSRTGAKAAPTASVPYRWAEKMPTRMMTEINSTVSAYSNAPDDASNNEDHIVPFQCCVGVTHKLQAPRFSFF